MNVYYKNSCPLIYANSDGDVICFPAGTDFVYDDIDDIVSIFESLGWIDFEDHDNDPMTPDEPVAQRITFRYELADSIDIGQ